MNRPIQTNRYQHKVAASRFTVRGVSVARLLVGLLLALNVVLICAILFSSNGLPGYRKQNRQVKELEEKVLKLKIENQKLFEMVQIFKTNPKAQEKLVRHELGWVREDEIIMESADKGNGGADKAAVPITPFSIPK
jgi:cell division protein FtsB